MKKGLFGIICMLAFCFSAEALQVTSGGKPHAGIVLEEQGKPRAQLQYAAEELGKWVKKISGAELPRFSSPDVNLPVKIILGTPESSPAVARFAAANKEAFDRIGKSDGFIIREEGDRIYIAALRNKGVLNGVYRFLERNSDIIWVREREAEDGFGTIYSRNPDLKNSIRDLVDVPVFPKHRYWTNHSRGNSVWQARLLNNFNRPLDGNMTPDLFAFMRKVGNMDELSGSLGLGLLLPYSKEHPEYFPLVKGKRVTYHDCQLCFMNPETIKAFCREAEKVVLGNPRKVTSYNIGLGDNWDVCECELCTAPIKLPDGRTVQPGDKNFRSTQYALFTNAVSDYLTKRFPWVKPIGAAAYLFTAEAPAVQVRGGGPCYCPYIKNHKKPVYDDTVNKVWHEKAEAFRKAGMPVAELYEYYLCSSTPQFYHAISEVAQKDFQYYRPGLQGIYLDVVYGDTDNNDPGGVYDVSAIEFWVMSRLMWNPDIDVAEARREFCRRAYREAAPLMISYYEKLAENYNSDSAGCFWNDDPVSAAKHYIVEKNLASFVRETLSKAEKAAVHPGSRELIRRHRVRMEDLISKAEKLPDRQTLAVPNLSGAPVSLDPDSDEWKKAAKIESFTAVSNAKAPAQHPTRVYFRHDRSNLYVLFDFVNPKIHEMMDKLAALPDKGMSSNFDWGACVEMFFDGDLRSAGSYYHMAFMMNGRTHTGQGPTEMENPPEWSVQPLRTESGARFLVRIPLSSIGVNISQGNKIGAMFVGNGGAWNGGQWHSPTGFQTLQLNMD